METHDSAEHFILLTLNYIFHDQIEAIMNDFIQLKPQSNVYEAETMVEGAPAFPFLLRPEVIIF